MKNEKYLLIWLKMVILLQNLLNLNMAFHNLNNHFYLIFYNLYLIKFIIL